MIKRTFAVILVISMLFAACPVVPITSASDVIPEEINASNYLSSYSATLYSTGTTGKLKLAYQVYAKNYMTKVGIYSMVVRNSDGSVYQTIWGSVANGLQASNALYHVGTYNLSLISGHSYYCVVTVIAKNSSGSDTRTITTSLVTCP